MKLQISAACRIDISMSRFNFGSLESEPGGLADVYRVLSDAQGRISVCSYSVPSELQTREYAEATLRAWNGPELVTARADTRMRREGILSEAGVPRTVYLGAAALRSTHWADRGVMLGQLDWLRTVVETEIEKGPGSRLRVGIVPTSRITPLPEDLPPGISLLMPRDVSMVETDSAVYAMGNDDFEVDRIGDSGIRGIEARRRLALLGDWASMAVFGEAALAQVAESRAVLHAA